MKMLLIISTLLFHSTTYANLAQVIKLRGSATYIANGMKEAKNVEIDQWLPTDTSILTADKSFIILKYKNGNQITLGPNSKIIIDLNSSNINKDQQVVSLIVGKIKASVRNQAQTDTNKVIIKTKTAALGIRGTEFQTSYNPQSKITSLLTFHGAVAMTKMDPKSLTPTNNNQIEENLKKESVMVKLGEFSSVNEESKKLIEPVKIAPEQFTKLKLNETLGAEAPTIEMEKFKEELKKTEEDYKKADTSKQNNSANLEKVKPGGYIDPNSGIYLAPTENSELDKNLNIYRPKAEMGSIDNNGNYEPPKGAILDPVKGLITEENAPEETKSIVKELNKTIEKQTPKPEVIIKKKSNLDSKPDDVYQKYYTPNNL